MKKITFIAAVFLSGAIIFTGCKKEEETPAPAKINYTTDIKAIFTANCSGGFCHIGGNQPKKWDDYTTAKNNITVILDRIQRTPGSTGFMPRGAAAQLPQASIDKLKQWVTDGLLEK